MSPEELNGSVVTLLLIMKSKDERDNDEEGETDNRLLTGKVILRGEGWYFTNGAGADFLLPDDTLERVWVTPEEMRGRISAGLYLILYVRPIAEMTGKGAGLPTGLNWESHEHWDMDDPE